MQAPAVAVLLIASIVSIGCRSTTPSAASPSGPALASSPAGPPGTPGVGAALRQRWLEMFARGYFPGRSGQVFFVPHEGEFLVDKDPLYSFMHGSPWPYDTRIPLLFYGPGFIRTGVFPTAAQQQDVAPTLARLLQIPPPATTTGSALQDAVLQASGRPRVIALLVLDGMRADYFERYSSSMPTLTRWRQQGAWFPNAETTSLPTATSIGHATLGTGSDPRIHGLVVNRLFNRTTGKSQESYDALDPGELMALTLADVWNLATDGAAIIVGQGGAIRATAGLIGHGACLVNGRPVLAASYAAREQGVWETNPTCYTMPGALKTFVAERYWKEAGGRWMDHDIGNAVRFRSSALFQRFEGEALAAVLESQPLGEDDVTDLVFVNFKSPDYVSHAYGPDSAELRETLAELDRQVLRALQIIEQKAGASRFVLAVSSDHGMPGEPGSGKRRMTLAEISAALNAQFSPQPPSIVHYFGDAANAQIHLDTVRLRALGHSTDDVARFLEAKFFAAAFTEDDVRAAQEKLRTR